LNSADAAEWVKHLRGAYEVFEGGSPQYRLNLWKATFDTEGYRQNFKKEQEQIWSRDTPTTGKGVVDRVFSKSYIAMQPDAEKAALDKKIKDLLHTYATSKRWIDQDQGIFAYPYQTRLITMHRV
jgi:hypothetical protein